MATLLTKRISKLEGERPVPLRALVEDIAHTVGLCKLREMLELEDDCAWLREYWRIKQERLSPQELEQLDLSIQRTLSGVPS